MDGSVNPQGVILTLFGASGDLTRRKLLPSLFRLFRENMLPENFLVVGFARSEYDSASYRALLHQGLDRKLSADEETQAWEAFLRHVVYLSGDYRNIDAFYQLRRIIDDHEARTQRTCVHLFYLATPPEVFTDIGSALFRSRLITREDAARKRVAIEKPFGHDLESSRRLNRSLLAFFDEAQIFRIDHYLGKETVQNILFLRFANGIFEPIWNRNYIDHIQFTVAEDLVLEGRVGYYDAAGALRDIVQNHCLQLLCLVTMEPPTSLDAEAIRDPKVNVLKSIRPQSPGDVLTHTARGQYLGGSIGGRPIIGYLEEEAIPPDSKTETYVAWKLFLDNWRWQGVPFYLRSGKGLKRKVTEIVIQFQRAPHMLFDPNAEQGSALDHRSNTLRLRLQPDEGIEMGIGVKTPGPSLQTSPVRLEFDYEEAFGPDLLDAYERLLLDLIAGDRTLFTRQDEVEIAWSRVSDILDAWSERNESPGFHLPGYAPGSWGPRSGDDILHRDGRRWRTR